MTRTDAASFDEFLAGGIFSSPETRINLEILCDDFGSCFAGTPGEEEAALFLEGKLREYGLENVRTEPFEYNGWARGPARLSMTSPRQRDLESLSMPMAAPGLVRGRVVDLGYGAPEDFEARRGELAGNIALVAGTNPPGAGRWIHRIEKYNRSVLAGAAGFIWTGHSEGVGPFTGAVGFNCWGLIPAVMVSWRPGCCCAGSSAGTGRSRRKSRAPTSRSARPPGTSSATPAAAEPATTGRWSSSATTTTATTSPRGRRTRSRDWWPPSTSPACCRSAPAASTAGCASSSSGSRSWA